MRILFDSKLSQFKTPFGVQHPGKPCTMHIQIPVSCRTTRVQLLLLRENCGTEREIEMSLQERGELSDEHTVGEIVKAYAMFERGLMYDWCLSGGEYSLVQYARGMMPMFLEGFRRK